MAQLAKNLPAMQDTWVQSLVWEGYPKEVNGLHTQVNSYPFQYSGLENFMDCMGCKVSERLSISLSFSY